MLKSAIYHINRSALRFYLLFAVESDRMYDIVNKILYCVSLYLSLITLFRNEHQSHYLKRDFLSRMIKEVR